MESVLRPPELALWRRMSGADRRHAVAVARRADRGLAGIGGSCEPALLGAALLHDVGKIESGLGTAGRVVATLAAVAGLQDALGRMSPRMDAYLHHDRIGAELLRGAGSDARTVAWAAEHHLPPARWTLAEAVGSVLKAADDD